MQNFPTILINNNKKKRKEKVWGFYLFWGFLCFVGLFCFCWERKGEGERFDLLGHNFFFLFYLSFLLFYILGITLLASFPHFFPLITFSNFPLFFGLLSHICFLIRSLFSLFLAIIWGLIYSFYISKLFLLEGDKKTNLIG